MILECIFGLAGITYSGDTRNAPKGDARDGRRCYNSLKMEANPDIRIPNETERRGQAFLRALPIMLIPLFVGIVMAVVISVVVGVPFGPEEERRGNPLVPVIVMSVFFIALIALVRFGRPNLSSVIFIGVWTLLTTLFGLQSGVNGFWAALLIVPICAAGLLIDGAASISLAALATLLIVALGLLEWFGVISPHETIPAFLASFAPFLGAGFWIGIFWTVAGLTYVLSNSLQRALKSSRAQARELQELSASLEARVASQTAELLEQSRQAAVVEERARVARDIHDTLAQGLTGIVVQLGAAQRAMEVTERETDSGAQHADAHRAALEHLTLAQGLAREALAEARRSIWNLRASSLERGELRDALAGLAARASSETTRVTFAAHGEPWQLNASVESALLRVAQEGLVNAARHANATQVDVGLDYGDDAVRLLIHDNGVGLDEEALNDANAIKNPASGFGLMGMRERLAQWDGELKLTNEEGARVEAIIPRARAEGPLGP